MSNARYVNIIKVALFNSDPFIKVANNFKSVYRQHLCVRDGYLTV